MATEEQIKKAIWKRADFIVSNLETVTLKSCRRQLEDDLGLPKDALKPAKEFISLLIDQVIKKHKAKGATPTSAKKQKKAAAEEDKQQQASKDQMEAEDSEEEERPRKKKKKVEGGKPSKRAQHEEAGEKKAPRQYSRAVEKMRAVCRAATITIPPSLYVKNKSNEALEAALDELLSKHNLNADSSEKAIAKVKARLTTARELEGIDTSNIIEGGRRPRAAAQAARANYAATARGMGSEDESNGEGSSSEDEDVSVGAGSDAEEEASMQESEEPSAAASESKEEADAAESSEDAKPQKQQRKQMEEPSGGRSPNENAAPAGTGKHQPASAKKAAPSGMLDDSDDDAAAVARPQKRVVMDWSDDNE